MNIFRSKIPITYNISDIEMITFSDCIDETPILTKDTYDEKKVHIPSHILPKMLQTNVLNVHFRFETKQSSDYVAIFTRVARDTVKIDILTIHTSKPIPCLHFRISGGSSRTLPEGETYPAIILYDDIYLVRQNTERKSVIPRTIVQTWTSHKVTPEMEFSVQSIQKLNPEYTYRFFDDAESRQFIEKNFHPLVLRAYDEVLPGRLKSDIFRYCYLYKNGGVYMDMKTVLMIPLHSFIFYSTALMLVREKEKYLLSNSFLATCAENPLFERVIKQLTINILQRKRGVSCDDITGSAVLTRSFCECAGEDEITDKNFDKYSRFIALCNECNYELQTLTVCNKVNRIHMHKAYSTYYFQETTDETFYANVWKEGTLFKSGENLSNDYASLTLSSIDPLLIPEVSFSLRS